MDKIFFYCKYFDPNHNCVKDNIVQIATCSGCDEGEWFQYLDGVMERLTTPLK